ncbi:MAG: magnesium transporter [Paracoccaceae bacterium]|nr:magnesium transporter [Paracoccaceae bacterium]MDE2913871.1 magnesium transporter [Paracoccaceae bacterium]
MTDADIGTRGEDRAYEIDGTVIERILEALDSRDREALLLALQPLHPADIADILEQIDPRDRPRLLELWGSAFDGGVLAEVDEGVLPDLIDDLPPPILENAIRDLETDDVVDIIEDVEESQQEQVLDALDDPEREAVIQSLAYPEDSAARLMQRELVKAPTHWTVGHAIDHLRGSEDLPDRFYDVVIVDPKIRPVGKVPLSRLMSTPRDVALVDLMDEDFRSIPVTQNQADVAYAFNQYHMVSAPVVDGNGRLLGVVTIDDAMDVLESEADDDIRRLAGVGEDESLTDSVAATTRQRFPWLAVNLATSILASIVIAQFAGTIEAIVALAVLMPIVASMGGNAGTQTLTVAVRALATKDLTPANVWRVIRRETFVGVLNGIVFAVITGLVGLVWYGSPVLGAVLGMAMIGNLFVAGLAGIFIPLGLDRLGLDPAVASGAFVTTVTDVVGFFSFLALAALILL